MHILPRAIGLVVPTIRESRPAGNVRDHLVHTGKKAMNASTYARFRIGLPRLERRYPWLSLILDCYAVIDASVEAAINLAPGKPACKEGCASCCCQPIPLTPLEAAGMKLYVRNEMPAATQGILVTRLASKDPADTRCPFLLAGSCAIYQLRPVACRRYMVLGQPCLEDEDATATRPGDILRPSRAALRFAMALTLPYYAALGEKIPEPEQAFAFCAECSVILRQTARTILG